MGSGRHRQLGEGTKHVISPIPSQANNEKLASVKIGFTNFPVFSALRYSGTLT